MPGTEAVTDGPKRVVVLYNTDWEDPTAAPWAGADVESVQTSAKAIVEALGSAGFDLEVVTVAGRDLGGAVARLASTQPDLVFNLCESLASESRNEVVVPAMLDLFGLRYTGSDAFALGICLMKPTTKDVLRGRGVATPPHRILATEDDLARVAAERLDYPWFLKLAHEDASVGIDEGSVVEDGAALVARARALIERWKQPVLAERYISGREVNVTLIGNGDNLELLPLHEIDFQAMPEGRPHIVSYAGKWDEAHCDYAGTKPVPLRDASPALIAAIQRTARAAWDAVGLRDYGRVDLRIDEHGEPWVIDVNPNCDVSPDAGVARAAAAAGMSYPQLIATIARTAWRRYQGPA